MPRKQALARARQANQRKSKAQKKKHDSGNLKFIFYVCLFYMKVTNNGGQGKVSDSHQSARVDIGDNGTGTVYYLLL